MLNHLKSKLNNNKGFTLIELIVVIIILAILAAIALPVFTGIVNDAHDARSKAEAKNLYTMINVEMAEQMANTTSPTTLAEEVFDADGLTALIKQTGISVVDLNLAVPATADGIDASNTAHFYLYSLKQSETDTGANPIPAVDVMYRSASGNLIVVTPQGTAVKNDFTPGSLAVEGTTAPADED